MSKPAKNRGSNPYKPNTGKQVPVDSVHAKGSKRSFKIVHIPVQLDDAMTEWDVEYGEGEEVSCLVDRLKPHFAGFQAADAAKQREAFAANLRTHLKPGQELSESTLTQIMRMGSLVDTVPLVYNTKDVAHVGVTMYVDDQGASKELPMNRRATAVTQQCHQPMQVLGDAFIGRFFDDDDGYARHDFTLAELDGAAEWIALAQRQAAGRAAREAAGGGANAEQMFQAPSTQKMRISPKPRAARPGTSDDGTRQKKPALPQLPAAVEAHKKEGNTHFGAARYAQAVACYDAAIEACGADEPAGMHALFSNRSAARLGLGGEGSAEGALADARRCVALCPTFTKGFFRVGRAALAVGGAAAAREAAEAAASGLKLDKRNTDLRQLRDDAKTALAAAPKDEPTAAAAAAAPVSTPVPCEYSLATVDGSEDTLATFVVPPSLVELLETDRAPKTVLARGCEFELRVGEAPGTVTSRFYSPMPDMTASAIAAKIAFRAANPSGTGQEFCSIM